MHLAFDHHGIDQGAEIIDSGEVHHAHHTGVRINFHFANVATRRKGEIRWIKKTAFFQSRFDFRGWECMCVVGGEGDFAKGEFAIAFWTDEIAIVKAHAVGRYIQDVRGDAAAFGKYFVCGNGNRGQAHRAGTRTIGTHAELHLIGITVHNFHVVDRNAEAIRDELRVSGLMALPMGMTAREHLNGSGGVDAHLGGFP